MDKSMYVMREKCPREKFKSNISWVHFRGRISVVSLNLGRDSDTCNTHLLDQQL